MMEQHQKKLAALMFTDLVGSVALQQRLGTAAYMRYVSRHDEIFQECLAVVQNSAILNETGDGFLVRFDDPSDALNTALRLQWRLHGEMCHGERIRIRIGLHLGVVTEMEERNRGEKRAVGMPINLTARIMDLAEAGQILMTRAVYEDARNYVRDHPPVEEGSAVPTIQWQSHGHYEFKGNPDAIEVFEVGAEGIAPLTAPVSGGKATRLTGTGTSGETKSPATEAVVEVLPPEDIQGSDVLITYAAVDDLSAVSSQPGWISRLHRNLEMRVAQLSGTKVAVIKQPDAFGQADFESRILDQVPRAKTVVSILSPPFVKANGCRKLVETFWKRSEESGRFSVHDHARLLNVVKTPVDEGEIPPEIRRLYSGLAPYEFFDRDPESGRLRVFDEAFGELATQRFHERVYDVAFDLSQVLKYLGDTVDPGEGKKAPHAKTIFLAATTSDLEPQRDQLRRELIELGHEVLPRQTLPLVASELTSAVQNCLKHADLAIHFVGAYYGLVPEATDLSVVALQNQVAAEFSGTTGLQRLVWTPKGLQPQDERQAAFLRGLEHEPGTLIGAELVADTLENLKVLLHARWRREREVAEFNAATSRTVPGGGTGRVYLLCDRQDEEAIEPLEDFFYGHGIEVSLPGFEADESEVQQIHIQNLRDCDAALIYYGAAGMHWVDFNIRDLQKAAGYRNGEPIPLSAVYLAPPSNRRKDRFKSLSVGVLRPVGDSFDPSILEPFVISIRKAKEAAK